MPLQIFLFPEKFVLKIKWKQKSCPPKPKNLATGLDLNKRKNKEIYSKKQIILQWTTTIILLNVKYAEIAGFAIDKPVQRHDSYSFTISLCQGTIRQEYLQIDDKSSVIVLVQWMQIVTLCACAF